MYYYLQQLNDSMHFVNTHILNLPQTSPWKPILKLLLADSSLHPITGKMLLTNSEILYGFILVDLFIFIFSYEELMQMYGVHFFRPTLEELILYVYTGCDLKTMSSWFQFKYDYFATYNHYILRSMESFLEDLLEDHDFSSYEDFFQTIMQSPGARIPLTNFLNQTTYWGLFSGPLMVGDILIGVGHAYTIRNLWMKEALWEQEHGISA